MRRTLILLAVTAVLAAPLPAGAQSTGSKLSTAQQRAARIKSAYQRIGEEFARLEAQQGSAAIRYSDTQIKISRTQADIEALKGKLKNRIRAEYMMRGVGFFDFLLEARSFREFSLRYMALQQQSLSDEGSLLQLRKKTAELKAQQKVLAATRKELNSETQRVKLQGSQLSVSLDQANELVHELQGQLRLEQIRALFNVGGGYRGSGIIIPMAMCPVDGPHYVTNSFGDPRGGGTRRHQGNDIMSPEGTPVVAVADGTVSMRTGGLGGNSWLLQGPSALYYYAHLNDFSVGDGASVHAGQLIGHVGNTGDAAGGPTHVHFEIHPGQGWTQAIDPYPSLSKVC
jgi:murein DD-endopeptidase MepM/ murein hydrolase activator NlpD